MLNLIISPLPQAKEKLYWASKNLNKADTHVTILFITLYTSKLAELGCLGLSKCNVNITLLNEAVNFLTGF